MHILFFTLFQGHTECCSGLLLAYCFGVDPGVAQGTLQCWGLSQSLRYTKYACQLFELTLQLQLQTTFGAYTHSHQGLTVFN